MGKFLFIAILLSPPALAEWDQGGLVQGEDAAYRGKDANYVIEKNIKTDLNDYFASGKTPKFIRVNIEGYNVRKPDINGYPPSFDPDDKKSIDFKTKKGMVFAVQEMLPLKTGVAVRILVEGKERWIFVPKWRQEDFQFCESPQCFSDLAQVLDILWEKNIDEDQLHKCGVVLGSLGQQQEALPSTVEGYGLSATGGGSGGSTSGGSSGGSSSGSATGSGSESPTQVTETVSSSVGAESGKCVPDTRGSGVKPDFRAIDKKYGTKAKKQAFIEHMTPFALEIQATTGFPASVVIAQAALETGWGADPNSAHFKTDGMYGHSCFKKGKVKEFEVKIAGVQRKIRAVCEIPRPENEGGYYYKFDSREDSMYAYMSNLLFDPDTESYYRGVRKTVQRYYPAVAPWVEVVGYGAVSKNGKPEPGAIVGLFHYASDENYRSKLRNIVEKNNLGALETQKLCR